MSKIGDNIFHDAKLPHLRVATDAKAMAEIFAKKFPPTFAACGGQIENCVIERIQYRRGRRCRLLYRIVGRDSNGKKFDQWFFGKLLRHGQARRQYHEALAAENLQNGLWQPVCHWPELEMVVWAFPNDPDMPGLVKAADPVFVQAQINANLAAFGLAADWRCEQAVFERVKYMPGKRCVLRYNVQLSGSSGAKRDLSFYSKTYRDGMSRFHYQVLQNVYKRLSKMINIPRPLTHIDEANTLWQAPWEGRPLIETLEQTDWDKLFPQLAKIMACFHTSQCEGLPRAGSFERAFDSAQEDASTLGWLLPQHRARLAAVLETLAAVQKELAAQQKPETPIHGAIRLEQFLARERELALVDFDAAALGDPLYDVAEFITSLQYLEFTRGLPRHRLTKAAVSFRTSYESQVPWKLAPQRLAWYAVSALLSKMHDTWKNLDTRAMQKFDAILEVMEDWLHQCRVEK